MWLARTPSAVVYACAAMIPRLHGEDALRAISIGGVSSGTTQDSSAVIERFVAMSEGRAVEPRKGGDVAAKSGFKTKLIPTKRIGKPKATRPVL